MIESYSFGKISINGNKFTSDVIIFPDNVKSNWRREKGHLLQKNDLSEIIDYNPDVLIIGKGYYGRMNIPDETKQFLKEKQIECIDEKTKKACEIYNEFNKNENQDVVAALHLTC